MSQTRMAIGDAGSSTDLAVLEGSSEARLQGSQHIPVSPAERAILELVLQGRSHGQIAALRRTSKKTVANQIASIFAKLQVNSRRELILRVLETVGARISEG